MCVSAVFPAMVPERAKQPPVYRRSTRTIPMAAFARGGRHPFSRLSFFPHKHSHGFLEARTQKARCTTRPPSPGLEHVRIIYMPEFYVFNVSMKHRQCEREPGPDMLSVNATSAVVPFLYVV